MSEYAENGISETHEQLTPREQLAQALQSAELISLTTSRDVYGSDVTHSPEKENTLLTPLTRPDLKGKIPHLYNYLRKSGNDGTFLRTVEAVGWPDETDTFEHLQRQYRSLEDFKRHLTSTGETPPAGYQDDGKPKRVEDFEYPGKGLNNFFRPFVVEAFDHEREYEAKDYLRLLNDVRPHVLRAEALAPELIGSLRSILSVAYEESQRRGDAVPSPRSAYEDPLVVEGMYRAYMLMGRLVKADDETRHADLINNVFDRQMNIHFKHFTDVHRALVH